MRRPAEKRGRDNRKPMKIEFNKSAWSPKTELGKKVKDGEIKNIDDILSMGMKIMEPEIVDALLPNLESDLLLIGQSKGKFGGGQRRVFRQTQKKTREGNKPKFATLAVVGDKNGHIGIGFGKAKETVPAREKALRNARLNIFNIKRGAGSWEDASSEPHSIPFAVNGKCGSVELRLMPAPVGKGLIVESQCQKILELAGIKDVWSKTLGQTKTKLNLVRACERALKKTSSTKVKKEYSESMNKVDGSEKNGREN